MILSLYELLKHSVHCCREVDAERFLEFRDALVPLRHYNDRGPYMAFVERWAPLSTPREPLSAHGRYNITYAMWSTCEVLGAPEMGLELWNEMWPEEHVHVQADAVYLVDHSDRTYSVEWDRQLPWLPYAMYDATELLDSYPWDCEPNFDTVGPAAREWLSERKEFGPRPEMDVDAYYAQVVEELSAGFDVARQRFRDSLVRAAERESGVVVWLDENLSL